ncbi:MAG: PAS domain S-box protein [Cyanobacteria bacterium Co-bin13]|nr:PAS domain S-box protein [Cyanobacteria bacterium Co-bin13]
MSEAVSPVRLDDVLITAELATRSSKAPNLQAEIQALHTLTRQLAEQCQTMLKTLVTIAKDLCQAGTAGVSLLETTPEGEEIFRWAAFCGALETSGQETTPRHFSPCGTCLDCQTPQLYTYPDRYFTYLQKIHPRITESLVIPLMGADGPLGAIWIVSHDEGRRFDAEDVRVLTSLADFTAAALQSIHLRQSVDLAWQQEQAARQEAAETRQALDEAAQRAVDILESITDAFVCVDYEWQITYVNQEAARLTKLRPEKMVGKTRQALAPWAIGTVIEQVYQRTVAEEFVGHFEVFDESLRLWLEIHAYPCEVGFSIYFRDITQRKRSEAKRQQVELALQESDSRFRLIVESAKDYAIFTLDLNGIITSWNSGAERLLGYQEAEAIGYHSRVIFTPEDNERDQAEEEIQTALTQGRAQDERWHLRKDGSRFFASGLMTRLQDEAGNLKGLVKILRDVTESQRAAEREQFLLEASAVLAGSIDYKTTLFNIARLAVPFLGDFCFFDIINANHQVERAAWHHGDPGKWTWFDQLQRSVPPQSRDSHPIEQVLTSGQAHFAPQVTEAWLQENEVSDDLVQFVRQAGVRSQITVPLIAHARQLGALTVCLATTSDRHYTQADLTLAQELGHRAALALDSALLYQQAQEVNRMKDEFLAVLSHELRSPLNPILGWVKLIQKGNLDAAKTTKAWATIERNAKLQAQLVEDLLDISRILRGKLSLDVSPVNLTEVVQSAIETVQLAAQSKTIALEATLDAPILPVLGDATRLQQTAWNLLSNAVKFTPAGGQIEVKLSWVTGRSAEAEKAGAHHEEALPLDQFAQLTVSDTGKGISADFLPHVFDYFRQADSATTRQFGGLGLGLAITRQIVEAHGGTVRAESPGEEQGATFTVKLPLAPAQSHHLQSIHSVAGNFNLQNTQILVVDDEPDALEVAAFSLQQAGANILTARSASEALDLLTQSCPDILLSDIGMPHQDGYTLMRQIRRLPPEQGGQIPAIALTAYAGEVDHQQAMAAGFQRHLSKPVEPEALIRAIAELMQQNPPQKPGTSAAE